jgi:hypothetical protein
MKRKWIFLAPLAIVGVLLFIALGGEIVRQLWNWLMPPLFGLREITFWQALGILALCRILFGGFGSRAHHGGNFRSRFRRRLDERLEHTTPEERERFRQGLRGRCGFGESTSEAEGK